jgi:hypothetical protein
MNLRRIQLTTVAVVFFALFVAAATTQTVTTTAVAKDRTSVEVAVAANASTVQGWVFEGCFTYFPSGPCRDVYRDSQGNYWICRACGTTGTPSSRTCSRISIQTLNQGYWCS